MRIVATRPVMLDQILFRADGGLVARAIDGIIIWDSMDAEPRSRDLEDCVSLAIDDATATIYAALNGTGIHAIPFSGSPAPLDPMRIGAALAFHGPSRTLIAGSYLNLTGYRISDEGFERIWSQRIDARPSVPAFSPDGQTFMVVEDTGASSRLAVRSSGSGGLLLARECSRSAWTVTSLSPDGRTLAAPRGPKIAIFTGLPAGQESNWIGSGSRLHFTDLAFHPSGRFLAATSNDATVKLYDTKTWKLAKTYSWNIGRLRSIAFSPDGMLAAAGSDSGRIVVWDVEE